MKSDGPSTHDDIASQIGTLLCLGIPGPTLDDATRAILEQLHVGTVILFRRNVGTLDELTALCAALHDLPSRPLVAIDHEGGRVMRLGPPFTHFPAAAVIGRSGSPEKAYEVGCAMAAELRCVGIDLSFAPVLDVNSNPANPVIGDRAFAADPALVARLGVAQMQGLLDGGVLPCGKHFPGHGDTTVDSHFELPTVPRSRVALEQTELLPFRAAIAAGIPMLLTAHVVYPALDPQYPATLSPIIINELLRCELGFDGVVGTDDLDMHAITHHYEIGDVAVTALQAGVDMLLICNALDKAQSAAAALADAIEDGTLAASIIATAAGRIRRMRSRLPIVSGCDLPSAPHQALADSFSLG